MIPLNRPAVQAFPIHEGTLVNTGGVSGFTADHNLIIHLSADSTVTINYPNTTITFDGKDGWDFTVTKGFTTLDISGSCMIS